MTSHAAVVARGWGKCCVSGCSDIRVNDAEKVVFEAVIVLFHSCSLSKRGNTIRKGFSIIHNCRFF